MATKKSRWGNESTSLILEVVLILAAVLIFRSSWMLLDSIPWFSTPFALVMMFILGTILTMIVITLIFQHNKKKH